MKRFVAPMFLMALLTGCATSFDKLSADRRLGDVNIEKAGVSGEQLKKPFKLAIFADMETVDSPDEYYESWDWTQTEYKMIESYASDFKKEGFVSEYFFIPEKNHSIRDLNAVMKDAESGGADAMVAIRGVIKVNKYMNPAALLDPTIVGALWLPGSNRDVMMLSRLDMWNVKNREILITAKADCIRKTQAPTFLINTLDTVNEVRIESMRKLLISFKTQMNKTDNERKQLP